jgi:hypothetical protein
MLYGEIIDLCPQIHIIQLNTVCGQKVELLYVKLLVHHVTGSVYKVNRTECERYWRSQMIILNCIIPLNTQPRPLHLKTQSVPRCKHFSSQL